MDFSPIPILSTLIISFLILFGFFLIQKAASQTQSTCKGSVYLTLSPTNGYAGDTITASISGLESEGCLDKRVYVKESDCQGLQYCTCTVNSYSTGTYGCVCTFRAPMSPYTAGVESSQQTVFTYVACADLNGNGIYDENIGEQGKTTLFVYSRYAQLSLMTESILVIIVLGVLLSIAIIVFRMTLRRR